MRLTSRIYQDGEHVVMHYSCRRLAIHGTARFTVAPSGGPVLKEFRGSNGPYYLPAHADLFACGEPLTVGSPADLLPLIRRQWRKTQRASVRGRSRYNCDE